MWVKKEKNQKEHFVDDSRFLDIYRRFFNFNFPRELLKPSGGKK